MNVPVGVAQLAGAIAPGVELQAGADRVAAGGDVEIVGDRDGVRVARAAVLRAAGVEGVQHQHGRRGAGRREAEVSERHCTRSSL